MLWKHIYNSNKMLVGSDIGDAVERAMKAGYNFVSFNGVIWFISEDGIAHDTGIKASEIAG
jgi:hypothetical protein